MKIQIIKTYIKTYDIINYISTFICITAYIKLRSKLLLFNIIKGCNDMFLKKYKEQNPKTEEQPYYTSPQNNELYPLKPLELPKPELPKQKHNHEIIGKVEMVYEGKPHYHTFATISGEAIPVEGHDHIHNVAFRTNFAGGHYHEFIGRTSGAVNIGNSNRHVHYLESITLIEDNHCHKFSLITLINEPYDDEI